MNAFFALTWLGVLYGFCAWSFGSTIERVRGQAEAVTPSADRAIVNISYGDAKPILDVASQIQLPTELRALTPAALEQTWSEWVSRHDVTIRSRVARGDEDSIVNLLVLGTTFTNRPRATVKELVGLPGSRLGAILDGRLEDMASGIASLRSNERLQFARSLVERAGINPADENQVRSYLLQITMRMIQELDTYDRVMQINDPASFARQSTLFRDRGLSTDASIFPNFAIERTLAAIKSARISGDRVRRVAIVGPGLDFIDKDYGYDFYPPQTIQPFALIDSLIRLGLAKSGDLHVATFDLSPRINRHLETVRQRAGEGEGYVMQVPLDRDMSWKGELVAYWRQLGSTIGEVTKGSRPPRESGGVQVRAVRVRPAVVTSIIPHDLNIVLQRLEQEFDLIVATNVLAYYDVFEQALALANVARMLRPGGLLLANSALPDLPGGRIRSVGYTNVGYVNRPRGGDRIVWYQRQ